jgi:hypothetical protein
LSTVARKAIPTITHRIPDILVAGDTGT